MNEAFAAFFGAIVGSGLMVVRDWIAGAISARKRAKYLAIRVVPILDRFVDQCAAASRDDGHLGPRHSQTPASPTTAEPEPIVFPDDIDWKSIDHRLAFDLLSLGNQIYDLEQDLTASGEIASPPDYERQYVRIAIGAAGMHWRAGSANNASVCATAFAAPSRPE